METVEFEDISIIEGTGGYMSTGNYNPETGNRDGEYYRYSYTPSFVVTLKDGMRLQSERGSITYNGEDYYLSYSDDQSYETPWGVGTHTVEATFMRCETSFDVNIVESPYRLLEILQVYPITENTDCWENDNGDIIYAAPEVLFRVTDQDGKSFIASSKTDPDALVLDDQAASPWTVDGDNHFTLRYVNLSVEGTVELQPGSAFEYIEQNGGLYITRCRIFGQKHVEIPSEIEGKPVIGVLSLSDDTWRNNSLQGTESITIPDSVKTLGVNALSSARYSLRTLSIGSGVNNLSVDMIYSLGNLCSISVSENNPYFCDMDGIVYDKAKTTLIVYPLAKGENYTVPASVTNIDILNSRLYDFVNITIADGSKMFVTEDGVTYNADKTKVIRCDTSKTGAYVMPDTVTSIADNAFYGCAQLTSVKISDNVTDIVYNAFADCGALAQVTLPSKLTSIECWAFTGCEKLASIAFPGTLQAIGEEAFAYSGLTSVSLPKSITDLGNRAFLSCENLTSVNLPDTMTYLGNSAFENCIGLTEVVLPQSMIEVGDGAFYGCENLKTVSFPSNIKTIGDSVFSGCSSLQDISLPLSLQRIEDRAFSNCKSLANISLPRNLQYIGKGAFSSCSALKEMTIPDSVKTIGDYAFAYCGGMESVAFGKGLAEIPPYAFYETDLHELHVPETIKRIERAAFALCNHLSYVEFANKNLEMDGFAFVGCPLNRSDLPDAIETIGDVAEFYQRDIQKLVLPNGVTSIAYGNFKDCSNLTEIDIPETVISMGGYAFHGTAWFDAQADGEVYLKQVFYTYKGAMPVDKELTIKEGTTVIADYALEERSELKALKLPDGLKTIGAWSFFSCSSLETITIPASVTTIDTSAFAKCSSLTAIHVSPDNPYYKSVDGVLFSKDGTELLWCPNRQAWRYEVPETVTKIATGAFSESGVSSVRITNPNTELSEYCVGYQSVGCYSESENAYMSQDFGWDGGKFERKPIEIVCAEDSTAYAYAQENRMLATVPKKVDVTTDDGAVSVSGMTDAISENMTVTVVKKSLSEMNTAAVDPDKYAVDNAVAYEISLAKSGICVQPDGKITVSIKVPENLNGWKCSVLYIDAAGHVTDMRAVYREGYMHFQTDHFSDYMIVESTVSYIPGDLDWDGKINSLDGLLLLRHLNGWDVDIAVPEAMDVNGDGKVTSLDGLILLRYLNGWDVTLGKEQ